MRFAACLCRWAWPSRAKRAQNSRRPISFVSFTLVIKPRRRAAGPTSYMRPTGQLANQPHENVLVLSGFESQAFRRYEWLGPPQKTGHSVNPIGHLDLHEAFDEQKNLKWAFQKAKRPRNNRGSNYYMCEYFEISMHGSSFGLNSLWKSLLNGEAGTP